MKDLYTTGEVAKICRSSSRMVSKWIDTGRLPGFRIPGSRDRRVTRENLVRFLKESDVPVDEIPGLKPALLLIGCPATITDPVRELVGTACFKADTAFQAGILLAQQNPQCLVIDADAFTESETQNIASTAAGINDTKTLLIGQTASPHLFTETFSKPVDPNLLAISILKLVPSNQ